MVEWRNSYAWLNQKIADIRAMGWNRKTLTAAGLGVGILTFGIGFVTARATEGGNPVSIAVSEVTGSLWGKPRDARARRASDVKPAGFTIWRDKLNTTGNAPRACLQMTKPLDPSKSYGDYVLVSPELPTPPAVTVNNDELCVSGFGFTDRRITLLKGLPAKSGETLAANISRDFTFGEKPPYVGFAGNGVILPREEADGVAVETVNVSALDFEVWRIADRNLVRKSIAAPAPTAEGDWADDWGDDSPDDEGSVIWKGQVKVRAGNGEKVTTVFPLGSVLKELKPGAYVIKVRDASGGRDKLEDDRPAQARRWILFTDMALTTYSGSGGLDMVVRSLGTARVMSGVGVTLVAQNGEELARAKTDANGRASFAKALLKGTGALTPKMVMAYGPDQDFTALDLNSSPMDLSSKGVGGRQDESATDGRSGTEGVDGFVYTDRGIYRPGETVHLISLVRDAQSQAVKDRKGALVIYRPSGVEAYRFAFGKTPEGFAGADILLPKTAPRGQWRAELKFEGSDDISGSTSFAVEDFAPQRLGVDIKAESERPLMGDAEVRPVRVNARFLYGATGSGLQVTGEARLRADPNPFPALRDYRFGNEVSPFAEKYVDLPETVTDGNGDAVYPFAASQAGDTDQPVVALVTSSVFEPGGRPVRESETLRIRTRSLYLGAKIENGPDAPNGNPQLVFGLIGVNASGDKVAVNNVRVKIIAENVRYDWYQADGRWRWRRTTQDVVVSDKVMAFNANTGANFTRNLEWGDYRLELEAPDQKAKTVVRFSSGWGQSASEVESPDFVRLSTGTRAYAQGDTVALTIKAPYRGEAQIAVATDRLIDLKTVSVGEGGTTVRLNTNAAWGGGAYIMVSVMQARDPVDSSKPRRAMGLVYVPLDPKSRKLTVDLDLNAVPQKPVVDAKGAFIEVPVKVGNMRLGERARLSLAVVDQGIINLTKFKSPDPVGWYFGKKALGVEYRDDYGRLLDPNLGAPAGLNYGGDQLGGEGLSATPIKTVALWSGIVETGLDGKAKVRLAIPKFSGELKVMAVAWTDGAVGSSSDKLIVREPVVTQLDLPRFLAPGDKALATLSVHNVDGKPDLYTVVINGLKGIFVNISKMFQLKTGERVAETIAVNAPDTAGVGAVHVAVKSPGYAFEDTYDIETRNGWGTETKIFTEQQQPGQAFTPPGSLLDGYQPGSVRVQVSYSPFKGIDPGPIVASLSRYPYGCTEQITSAAYPWVYVSGSISDDAHRRRSEWLLKQAVSKILDRQAADGAFGLWRAGDGEADGWLGAYATDFLIEAQRQGASVPREAMEKALNGMRQIAKPEGTSYISYRRDVPEYWYLFGWTAKDVSASMRSRASAYALYVLAKAGSGDLARLRWYLDVQFAKEKSPLARAQVAAALTRMGDRARGRAGFEKAVETLGYKDENNWYQSPLRDLAGVIALAYESGFNDIGQNLAKRLETEIKNPDNLNTQEQAQLLRAASFMLKASGPLNVQQTGAYPVSDKGNLLRYNVGSLSKSSFVNKGSGAIWRTVSVTGAPLTAPAARSNGFSVDKVYYSMQGQRIDPSKLVQGQKVIVVISGRSAMSQTRPAVIDDALPAGLEIEMMLSNEDTKSGPFGFVGALTSTLAQEARDDRFIAALNTTSNNGFAVAYIARAVTQGDFYLPGVEVKDFYRTDLSARTVGSRMTVAGR